MIASTGLAGCSVEAICHRAGFTRGAFYSNFSSKDDLFAALAEDEYARLTRTLTDLATTWPTRPASRRSPSASDQRDAIRAVVFAAIDAIAIDPTFYLVHTELLAWAVRDPAWGAELVRINAGFVAAMGDIVQAAVGAAGRELTGPVDPLVHAAIAIILRSVAVAASLAGASNRQGVSAATARARALALGDTPPPTPPPTEQDGRVIADALLDTLVNLLLASSAPIAGNLGPKSVARRAIPGVLPHK